MSFYDRLYGDDFKCQIKNQKMFDVFENPDYPIDVMDKINDDTTIEEIVFHFIDFGASFNNIVGNQYRFYIPDDSLAKEYLTQFEGLFEKRNFVLNQ